MSGLLRILLDDDREIERSREASGYRLEIRDGDGDNLFVTDSGGLTAALNLRPGQAGTAGRIAVAGNLLADPNLLALGELSELDAGWVFGEGGALDHSAAYLRMRLYWLDADITPIAIWFRRHRLLGRSAPEFFSR